MDKHKGVDNSSCLKGDIPCATFNMALMGLIMNNSTVMYISPGTYTLKHGNETNTTIGPRLQELAIIGNDTVIVCDPLTGFEILSSSSILLQSIVFNGCGKIHWLSIFDSDLYFFQAALYFNSCHDVTLSNVTIQNSNGTGLFLYQSGNSSIVQNSLIVGGTMNNTLLLYSDYIIVGGIVIIGDENDGQYLIISSGVIDNHYGDNTNGYCDIFSGGGITVISSAYKPLVIDSCIIANNSRGLVMYGVMEESVQVYSSNIYNMKDSKIILPESFTLELFNVNMTDTLSIVYDYEGFYLNTTNISNGYTKWNHNVNITAHFTHIKRYNYSIDPEKWNPADCFPIPSFIPDSNGRCYHNNHSLYTGHCPVSYSICEKDSNNCSCHDNHAGPLCGQCIDGYSVAINSPYLSCVPCDNAATVIRGWVLLLVMEFIPLTVMILIIAILNVNLNQGSLNAYIFLCQMMTISFPSVGYPAWLVSLYNYNSRFVDFILLPFSIWNLGFINFPSCNLVYWWWELKPTTMCSNFFICLSSSLSPLGAISFWYIIAVYPLFILMVIYACIAMYKKQYGCVVCVVRPIHRVLTCFWTAFDIQPSLAYTTASILTLCFTQLAATSFKILHPSWYHDHFANVTNTVFFYDGSLSYFNGWHGLCGMVALFVLTGLIISTLYLLAYPFLPFQKYISKLLLKLTNVFTKPYKDGSDNTWDFRYFAGTHFALQLIFMIFYYIPFELQIVIGIFEGVICIIYAFVLVIFRPYKRLIHNVTEIILFLVLMVFAFYQFYPEQSFLRYNLVAYVLIISPILGSVLLLVVVPYCLYWLIQKLCHCKRHASNAYKPLSGNRDPSNIVESSDHQQQEEETNHMFKSLEKQRIIVSSAEDNTDSYGTL